MKKSDVYFDYLHFVLVALVICNSFSIDSVYDLKLLNDSTALCLDGSPGAYYISRQGDPNKIVIQFQGGGWCGQKDLSTTLQSCYQRSKTDYGSSVKYPKTRIFNQGILSLDENNNFKNWTKVLLMYCDGAGHQGTSSNPIKYKDATLYFRGNNITVAQFEDLDKKNQLFSNVTQIVVGGASAGGLAVYLWTNYVVDRAKNAKVWALADSGIFLDSVDKNTKLPLYKLGLQNVMKLSNVQIDPPVPQCAKKFPGALQNCMFAQNIYMYIKVPTFHIQSLYDIWSIPNILGIKCISGVSLANCSQQERIYIEQYHRNTTSLLLQMGNQPNNGFWAAVCAYHSYSRTLAYYSLNFRIPMGSQYSVVESVSRWMTQSQQNHKHIDVSQWPENKPCSGVQNFNLSYQQIQNLEYNMFQKES